MTNFTVIVTDQNGSPVVGATVTATWSQFISGDQKEQSNTDINGKALFNIGVNDATVQFQATKGAGLAQSSAYVGILGDTSTPTISLVLTGSVLTLGTNGLVSALEQIKKDTTYIVIFGALGGGLIGGAWLIHKIKSKAV